MVELVDTLDLESSAAMRGSSSLPSGTIYYFMNNEEKDIFSIAAQSIAEQVDGQLLEFMRFLSEKEEDLPLYVSSENPLIREHVSKKLKDTGKETG